LETPAGLKATFLRSLARVRRIGGKGIEGSDLGARLAWSHALILERRRYVPTGWSKSYDFCDADLDSAVATLHLLEQASPDGISSASSSSLFRAPLRKLLGEALYGGRIESSGDDGTLAKVLATSLGSGEMLSLESMLLREGGGGILLKQGFLGQASLTSGSYEPIRVPIFSSNACSLEAWEKWGVELPSTLSPSVLGLSLATDLQLSVGGTADILRVAQAL
jgi:dynein heavy chain 1